MEKVSIWARGRALLEIVAAVIGLFVAAAVIGSLIAPHLPERWTTPVQALAQWGAVLTGALLLRLGKSSYREIGLRMPTNWTRVLLCTAGAIAISLAGATGIGFLIERFTDWPPLDVTYIRTSIEGDLVTYLIWMALVVWGSAGIAEELFGRGFVLDRMQTVFGRKGAPLILAIIAQAALFGLLHSIQGPSGILITAFIGIVFAGAYFVSGRNLWAPILAHGLVDSYSLTLMFLGVPLPGYIN